MVANENWENVRILGRTPVTDTGLDLIWSGSGVEFIFRGLELGIKITGGDSVYQPWISLIMDGAWIMHMPVQEGTNKVIMLKGLDPSTSHNIRIIKETQAMPDDPDSFVVLNSLLYDGEISKTSDYKYRIEFIGDSITWGYAGSKRQADVTFPDRVSQLTGAVCTNAGIPNCNFARKRLRDADSIASRTQMGVLNYYGYDLIVFACGTNDFSHNVKLGAYSDKRANTFCGAINETIKEAQTQNPEAEIIMMTPILRCRDNTGWYETNGYKVKNARGFTLADYCSAVKKLAKKNHVRCYDSEKMKVFTDANVKRLLVDGLHPTQAGYIALGESFAEYLEKDIKKD